MSNIFDYLNWRGDIPFSAVGPNSVDLLIFSQFVHMYFERLTRPELDGVPSLPSLTQGLLGSGPAREDDTLEKSRRSLWQAAMRCSRFSGVRLVSFLSVFEPKQEQQFAAAVFRIDEADIVVYRGTDDTLVGWKEDFNMGLDAPIPSQLQAVRFLEEAGSSGRPLYVCGHSKGGNLSMYAAAMCSPSVRQRLLSVQSFDGPGLSDAAMKSIGWQQLHGRVVTIIPESSVIGLLFGQNNSHIVVDSDSISIGQHNPFCWHVLGAQFVPAQKTTVSSRLLDKALDQFLSECSLEDRKILIETLYRLVMLSGADVYQDIPRGLAAHLDEVISMLHKTPPHVRKVIGNSLRLFAESTTESVRSLIDERFHPSDR